MLTLCELCSFCFTMHRVITTIVVYYLKGGITLKSLSKAEWVIMKALWDKPNQPISGIIQTIGDKLDWKYNTFTTYIKRMCDKGLLSYSQLGRDKFYYPAYAQSHCILAESNDLLEKIDQNATKELLVCMLRDSHLDADDYKELRALIDKLAKGECSDG